MIKIISNSVNETEEFGNRLGKSLKSGDIVCLIGDLGAGKTALTKSIVKGLDIDEYVTSPTFTLVNEYDGRVHVNHFDVYRVSDCDELLDIGFEEYIYSDSVTIIEWANLIEEILPKDRLTINIKAISEHKRELIINVEGNRYKELIYNLQFTIDN